MKMIRFAAETALICYVVTSLGFPGVIALLLHDTAQAKCAMICQFAILRLATFFFAGYTVARRTHSRRVACATITAASIATALLFFDSLPYLMSFGRSGGIPLDKLWIAIFLAEIPIAALGGWIASRRTGESDSALPI